MKKRGCVVLMAALIGPWSGAMAESDVGAEPREVVSEPGLPVMLYYERYRDNSFSGVIMRPFSFPMNEAESLFFSGLVELRGGRAVDELDEMRNIASLNLGLGLRYGKRYFTYTELGWDLLELIGNDLLTSDEDKEAGNDAVDVDWFFTLGVGWRPDPRWALTVHARYNDISGIRIRDTAAFYYGGGLSYLF